MKKLTALIISLALVTSQLGGCGAKKPETVTTLPEITLESVTETLPASAEATPVASSEASSTAAEASSGETDTATASTESATESPSTETETESEPASDPASPDTPSNAPETEESSPEASADPSSAEPETSTESEPPVSHYTFQPKVCSSYMLDVFGETMVGTWYSLVDAVMAGENTFACPDTHTYNWVMGQFPERCFPLLTGLITYCYDRDNPVKDGVASFEYTVPQEEAAGRIREFAALVEEILNETLEDDYSDLEKALALYLYFSHHYVYDYDTAAYDGGYPDWLSSYRVLTTGFGICQEFSVAYSYLLMQAGVDATHMSGHRSYDHEGHQWSYVNIHGHNFHIDPTYVIGSMDSLSYFMMDDAQREAEDCYDRNDFIICSNYAQDHPHPDYAADDDTFREIWGSHFISFDHETHTITYEKYDDYGELRTFSFDYTGW